MLSIIKKITTLTLLTSLLAGCHFGPARLPDDHMEYNKAVNLSLNQQLLLNVVRAHFNESTMYVSIENITSRSTYQASLGFNFFQPINSARAAAANQTLTATPSALVSEAPSFIYAPETNDKYAIELLQPLRLKALYLVIDSESDIGNVLRLMLRHIGPYINFEAQPLSKPYAKGLDSVKNFIRLTKIIEKIYAANGYFMQLHIAPNSSLEKLTIPIPKNIKLAASDWTLLDSVGIARHDPVITLCTQPPTRPSKDLVFVQIRSLTNVSDFLSFAVEENQATAAALTHTKDNLPIQFKYQKLLTNHLLQIHTSHSTPVNAFIAVHMHNEWFYISNNDAGSKITFRLLRIFNDLTQGSTKTNNILISS